MRSFSAGDEKSEVNKILITGSSGYVGNYLLKHVATKNAEISCIGMSRSGKVREGETKTASLENVSYVAGNVLQPETFESTLKEVRAVVHAVGGLFPSK